MHRSKQKNLRLAEIGEFGLLKRLFPHQALSADGLGIGDDCALIPKDRNNYYALTVDACVEDVHFKRWFDPFLLGRKVLAANLSDLAAKGARAEFALISWQLPKDLQLAWVQSFLRGFQNGARAAGIKVVGGNTSQAKAISVHVFLAGSRPRRRIKLRSHAKPGHLICVTGHLGEAAAGLDALLTKRRDPITKRHFLRPSRLKLGAHINRDSGVGATMDLSDGLLNDLDKVLEASHCHGTLYVDRLPLSRGCLKYAKRFRQGLPTALDWALSGGEDYELLFTIAPKRLAALQRAFPQKITAVGEVIRSTQNVIPGVARVIPGKSRTIPGILKVIPDAREVIPWGPRIFLQGSPDIFQKLKVGSGGFDHFG